ncbi:MAG: aminopeptidase N [Halobacteriovoraceae bacterium]|jgi:aminopeptidase N|nr:aminopeptidase N [Halobacteriovoraceae bacterium]MBT5093022.1 aminopeptidase N [Halobacteriovoraceae bacterium]
MKDATPKTIQLSEYQVPDYRVKEIHLTFELGKTKTKVKTSMKVSASGAAGKPLVLNGEELELNSVTLNGQKLEESHYKLADELLTIPDVPGEFTLEIENTVNPEKNTALDGLYYSGGMFCTQNEPEGFRRITFYVDRPDNLAVFTTKIIADKAECPVLLSNGNPIGSGELEDGRHWVEWNDPHPKPSYLYALVAGDLGLVEDFYTTTSGRKVKLQFFVDKGNESKCDHAMESLKKSMKWDEDRFGLEYDLDIYMIVAVDSFNMGAMENKGLNVFNSAYVLAKPESATDNDYFGIEAVIGHEYFHNWTGNRITCRDWFQLTLKEGLTVFRDQEFSSDMNSRGVNRINNVRGLRSHQFVEDAGPTAHPIRPASYIEINNFYTATVYEKGAEVIGMIYTLLGKEGFRKGMDKYFELFDGGAVTTDDFIHAMSVANGDFEFAQFKNWYSQAGTPSVKAVGSYNPEKKSYSLSLTQTCPETPGLKNDKPFFIPLSLGLLGPDGSDLVSKVINFTEKQQTFEFEDVSFKPVLSLNRDFTAPIRLETENTPEELAFLMAHDSDLFNRYEGGQVLAQAMMLEMISAKQNGNALEVSPLFIEAFGKVLTDGGIDNEFKALALTLPSEKVLQQELEIIDFEAIHHVREFVLVTLAGKFRNEFRGLYSNLNNGKAYAFNPADMGDRSLKNTCLGYLMTLADVEVDQLCLEQFNKGGNMTDQLAALANLVNKDVPERKIAVDAFYQQWEKETLVMQKWLAVQATSQLEDTFELVQKLQESPIYDAKVPNLVRSLVGRFCANDLQFHHSSGRGYTFIADKIIALDSVNPQMASSLARGFKYYERVKEENRALMETELKRILNTEGLSKNTFEITSKILG